MRHVSVEEASEQGVPPMDLDDLRDLNRIIHACTYRVSGKYYILKRRLFVMFNFLRERGYVMNTYGNFQLARYLGITGHNGTVSGYRKRFPNEWEEERRLIEAAACARANLQIESDITIIEPAAENTSSPPAHVPAPAPAPRKKAAPGASVYHFVISEAEIRRFRDGMAMVTDERDNRGKKYELVDILSYYVFRMLSANFDALHEQNGIDDQIVHYMDNRETIPKMYWVKDVIETRTDLDAFRRALLGWLKTFEIDAAHEDQLTSLLSDAKRGCDDMMRQVRAIVSFGIACAAPPDLPPPDVPPPVSVPRDSPSPELPSPDLPSPDLPPGQAR